MIDRNDLIKNIRNIQKELSNAKAVLKTNDFDIIDNIEQWVRERSICRPVISKEYIQALDNYINAIKVFNKYYKWKADWEDGDEPKYYLYINTLTYKIDIETNNYYKDLPSGFYFSRHVAYNYKMIHYLKELFKVLIKTDKYDDLYE